MANLKMLFNRRKSKFSNNKSGDNDTIPEIENEHLDVDYVKRLNSGNPTNKIFNAIKMSLYIQKLAQKRKESAYKVFDVDNNIIEENLYSSEKVQKIAESIIEMIGTLTTGISELKEVVVISKYDQREHYHPEAHLTKESYNWYQTNLIIPALEKQK